MVYTQDCLHFVTVLSHTHTHECTVGCEETDDLLSEEVQYCSLQVCGIQWTQATLQLAHVLKCSHYHSHLCVITQSNLNYFTKIDYSNFRYELRPNFVCCVVLL